MPEQLPFLATYPGVELIEAVSYVDTQGITPSVAQLLIVPQAATIPITGDLVLFQGNTTRTLKDCKVMKASLDLSRAGQAVSVAILDRRWKWAFPSISGHYNLRDDKTGDQQQIIPDTEKTPQELATLLLDAMGEEGYDLQSLPNDARPMVQWELANAAQELAQLCELLGCRIVRDLEEKVRLVKTGEGADLPYLQNEEQDEVGYDPPEAPDAVVVYTAPNRYQGDFRLEPYGQDVDGEFVPLNSLSYTPEDGWGRSVGPSYFSGVSIDGQGSPFLEDLARKYCYRLFRITLATPEGLGDNDEPQLVIPGASELGTITRVDQIEIEDVQVQTYEDSLTGNKVSLPATIRGTFYAGGKTYVNETFPAFYRGTFTIMDKTKGFILLDDYCWKISDEGERDRPTLILRCACKLRKADTREWVRHSLEGTINAQEQRGTKPKALLHDEMQRNVYPEYDANEYPTTNLTDNKARLEVEMSYYLDAARKEYAPIQTRTRVWPGLVPLALDGAIQQVSYEMSRRGCTTTASRNTEHSTATPSYAERRQAERARSQGAAKAMLDWWRGQG